MKLNIYAYFNNDLGCYSSPQFDDHEHKAVVVAVTRQLKSVVIDNKPTAEFERLEFHCLGTFDDVTGELVSKKEVLLSCKDVINGFKSQLAEQKDKELIKGDKVNA